MQDDGDAEVMPLRFVFGVNPVDNGDHLDPSSKGTPDWDKTFDISNEKSQQWLAKFCQNLRAQPFYRSTMGPMLTNCFIEPLRLWMERDCQDLSDPKIDYTPCCKTSKFPYKPNVLRQCAAEANVRLEHTPHLWFRNGAASAGVKFEKESLPKLVSNDTFTVKSPPKIKVLIVEYDSTSAYTLSFAKMDKFFHEVSACLLSIVCVN